MGSSFNGFIPARRPEEDQSMKDPLTYIGNIFNPPDRGEDYTIFQAIFNIDMLILFIATACGTGGALTEALKQLKALGLTRKPGQDLTCTGAQCYRSAFLIITLATLFGSVVSLILVFRTRTFYKGDIYKKFREDVVESQRDHVAPTGNGSTPLREMEDKATSA
ncbi:hypothetical protein CCACVL1_12203 [Corchorus capsularis]|uniref:Uncharacterized protein n=1 Tax=Corchorus capsularis TaxID=210143 RepID=A0A1R3IGV7_COCAP|nr:hypothetical protein CCACVL1_12203 [Corchorus capsularis]